MLRLRFTLVLTLAIGAASCAGKVPILVGQSALAVADTIGQLNVAGKQLTDAAIMTPAVNLNFQQLLLRANDRLKPLPDILRTIDRLQQAGSVTVTETDRAVAILTIIGQDISVVVVGVPISDATKALIDLVRAAQQTVQTVLIEVGKIKGRE